MTYTGFNPDVLLEGLVCEYCGYRIVTGQVRLVPKREQDGVSFTTVVPVHANCKEDYHKHNPNDEECDCRVCYVLGDD